MSVCNQKCCFHSHKHLLKGLFIDDNYRKRLYCYTGDVNHLARGAAINNRNSPQLNAIPRTIIIMVSFGKLFQSKTFDDDNWRSLFSWNAGESRAIMWRNSLQGLWSWCLVCTLVMSVHTLVMFVHTRALLRLLIIIDRAFVRRQTRTIYHALHCIWHCTNVSV